MLPGLLFIVLGLRWLVDPAGVAPSLGLTLETGYGLSSQVADLSAFFLVTGLSILIAVVTRIRSWFYPPVLLLLIAAAGRLIAWLAHGAAFAPQAIALEVVVAALLLVASRYLPERE
ncbi:MAG: hypothetical protein OXU70_11095 [Gammaproteobacteria bacterium]|nr:hypothetical protein [Gammaproteobacteria bacterium]